VLENAPEDGNVEQGLLNKQFYNVLFLAVRNGSSFHLADGVAHQDGYSAWCALKKWYGPTAPHAQLPEEI
jgi:hypothetical protein